MQNQATPTTAAVPTRPIFDVLNLLSELLAPQRRLLHAGDVLYQAGERFDNLYILNSGFCKVITMSPDGREQVVGLKFRGDWLGFDGIADGAYSCDAVAMDTGEIWVVRYEALLAACTATRASAGKVHSDIIESRSCAISRLIASWNIVSSARFAVQAASSAS